MQHLNPNLNISRNGEDGAMSEGYLIEVYEDSMVLYGVDFVNSRILAYATYESVK